MRAALEQMSARLSDRARYGLVLLAALVGFDVTSRLGDVALTQVSAREVAQNQFSNSDKDISLETWRERAAEASKSLEEWRNQLWRGPTPGIIAADIQSKVNATSQSLGLTGQQIEVDPTPIAIAQGEGLRFRIKVSAQSSAHFADFFGALEQAAPVMFIDELSLTIGQRDQAYFEVGGVAPIYREPLATNDAPNSLEVNE